MCEALFEGGLKLMALYASKIGEFSLGLYGDVHLKPLEAGFKLLVNKLHQDRPVACVLRALRFWQDSLKFLDQVGSKPALTVRLSGKQKRPPDIFGYAGRKASCSGAKARLLSSDRAKKVPRGSEPRWSRLLLDSNLSFLDVRAGAHGPGLISNRRG